MPALSFQKQFADAILGGVKSQTVRTKRKRPIKRGDRLYLYTGMRTKQCRKLGEAKCWGVFPVSIYPSGETFINNRQLFGAELSDFFKRDGFGSSRAGMNWFKEAHGLPFHGELIVWHEFTGNSDSG